MDIAGRTGDELFEGCELVVRAEIVNQRLAAVPLEVRSAASAWVDGRIWKWSSKQHAHGVRASLAAVYGLDPAAWRVIATAGGGGLGDDIRRHPHPVLTRGEERQEK